MNAAIITKIEFRLLENPEFSILDHTFFSGTLKQDSQRTRAGMLYITVMDFSVPKIIQESNSIIKSLNNRKAQFRATDANGTIYLLGNDNFPARLLHQKAIDGTPGSFGGYKCVITYRSPFDDIVQ